MCLAYTKFTILKSIFQFNNENFSLLFVLIAQKSFFTYNLQLNHKVSALFNLCKVKLNIQNM